MAIRIAITDDHILLVNGLLDAFRAYDHIKVTDTYHSGAALMKGLAFRKPDILLLDMQLPDSTGNELATRILQEYPSIRIIILTGVETSFHIKDILQQGCMGYLFKTSTSPELLIEAIENVYAGETFIDPSARDMMLNQMLKKNKATHTMQLRLTIREKEVLQLIAAQLSNQEIASKMFLSQRTVENHRFNLLQKLGVKNTAGLLMKALQMGLVD